MTIDIGNILIGLLSDLSFLDKYTGVVKPITKVDKDSDNRTVKKTFPVSCQATMEECDTGRYIDLVPDSRKRSVLYLEDKGARFVKQEGPILFFRSSFDLVCWLNMPALGFTNCSYSSIAIAGIISKIPINFFNYGNYQRVSISIGGQQSKMINPFQKYSYSEEVMQFLMYPYDHFVLPIEVDFGINVNCVEETALAEVDPCEVTIPPIRMAQVRNAETDELIAEIPADGIYYVHILTAIRQVLGHTGITIVQKLE